MRIETLDAADRELAEAVRWYDARRLGLGDELLEEFEHVLQRIAAFPNAWPKLSRRSRRCRLNRFPYGVVYQVREEMILIIAVMHLHRRPRYWRDRE